MSCGRYRRIYVLFVRKVVRSHVTRLDDRAQTLDKMTSYQYVVHHNFTQHHHQMRLYQAQTPVNLWVSPSSNPSISLHLSSHPSLESILFSHSPIILPNFTRFIPQPLELSIPILAYRPNALPQPLMSLPILLYSLLYLPLIQPLRGMRIHDVRWGVLGVGRDWAESGVGIFSHIVAFGEAGFYFEDSIREEDGLLL